MKVLEIEDLQVVYGIKKTEGLNHYKKPKAGIIY
jgi:hypothetical protein